MRSATGRISRPVNMPETPSPRPFAFGYLRCAPVPRGERESYGEMVLVERLREAIRR